MEQKRYLKLNDIEAYKIAFHLSNFVWNIVVQWKQFERISVGEQFVTAVDSISANTAEGFGRFNKKDKIKFYKYSYGSMSESPDWNQKAKVRKLILDVEYEHVFSELKRLPKAINSLILFTNERLSI